MSIAIVGASPHARPRDATDPTATPIRIVIMRSRLEVAFQLSRFQAVALDFPLVEHLVTGRVSQVFLACLIGLKSLRWTNLPFSKFQQELTMTTLRLTGAFLIALSCAGCISMQQTEEQVAVRLPGQRVISELRPFALEASRHLEYAWLSQSAYEKTEAARREPSDCREADNALTIAGWKRWNEFPKDEHLRAEIDRYHLRVEVWTKSDPPQVAIAFGGTVFNNGNDWRANLRWFLPRHDDQYTLVVTKLGPAFIEFYQSRLAAGEWKVSKPTVVATGHSLGGGLAQQFAYGLPSSSDVPRVTKVYAFHPSPVTGYFSVKEAQRLENAHGLQIERIYERGEILALLRSLQSVFLKPSELDPAITGYRYSVVHQGGPIGDHSLGRFACAIADKLK